MVNRDKLLEVCLKGDKMKNLIIVLFISALMLIGGCTKLAYYQPDKTLEEALETYKDCSLQYSDRDALYHCMVNKGYDFHNVYYDQELRYIQIHSGFFKIGIAGK